MHDKLMECLTNPIKHKLLLEVINQGQTTAKALAEKHKSIPQATLYRYLKKMVSDDIIVVVEERKIRNVTEKVYASNIDFASDVEKMIADNSGEAYLSMFQHFTVGLLGEFKAYAEQDDIDILNDGSGFRVTSFCATYDELEELSLKIRELVAPYEQLEETQERKARSMAVIFTPPRDIRSAPI